MVRSIIWFQFNSDRPREDGEVSSTTHLAIALRRIGEHAAVAGDSQVITPHGYASREGTGSRPVEDEGLAHARDAGIPAERITTVGHGPDSTFPGLK